MPIYTYECPKGHRFHDFGTFEERERPCLVCVRAIKDINAVVCAETAKRIPSVPAPAKFNCPMPTYQKPKT